MHDDRRLARLELDVRMLMREVQRERTQREIDRRERTLHPRIVRISYVNEHSIGLKDQWDYIDGIGNLKVGDRVITPRFKFPDCEGVVVAVDEPRRWHGQLKTITERRYP